MKLRVQFLYIFLNMRFFASCCCWNCVVGFCCIVETFFQIIDRVHKSKQSRQNFILFHSVHIIFILLSISISLFCIMLMMMEIQVEKPPKLFFLDYSKTPFDRFYFILFFWEIFSATKRLQIFGNFRQQKNRRLGMGKSTCEKHGKYLMCC